MLGEIIPDLARVAVLRGPGGGAGEEVERAVRQVAAARRILVQSYRVAALFDVHETIAGLAKARNQAIILIDGPVLSSQRRKIGEAAVLHGLPALSSSREYADAGGLVSYGPNMLELYRRVGYFVHRVVSGASPAEIPVEQPTRFELVINARTARTIGVTIPPVILARADEVIE